MGREGAWRRGPTSGRRLRSVGELLQNQFRIGFSRMERVIRERMTLQSPSQLVAVLLIAVGVVYFLLWFFKWRKTPPQTDKNGQNGQNDRSA